MNDILSAALDYAARGWPVFRLSKSKTPLKGTHGHLDATTNTQVIREWWDRANPPNIGLACGEIIVIDLDGVEAMRSPWGQALAAAIAANGGLPATAGVATRRGFHFYFRAPPGVELRTRNEPRKLAGAPGVDIKAHGGYVVMPPSMSKGFTYTWMSAAEPAVMPPWLLEWAEGCGSAPRAAPLRQAANVPAHLQGKWGAGLIAHREQVGEDELDRLWGALQRIPADGYDVWYQVGLALHSTGWEQAFELFDDWSALSDKYNADTVAAKWASFEQTSRGDITLGTVYHFAKQHGWVDSKPETIPKEMQAFSPMAPNQSFNHGSAPAPVSFTPLFMPRTADNPLAELNEKFAVIGDIGGKCRVLGWTPSKVDPKVKVPSFQDFRAFSERYAAKYIEVEVEKKNGDLEKEPKQLGAYWLKWVGRKSYEGIDLAPDAPPVLPGNILNLWSGFAVTPAPGTWDLMREHITDILADMNPESAAYILKFAAWCLQNPARRAEVALVFRGEKGSGKGTFARAIKDIFGQHGLHIFSSKHLTGNFNAHLRTCLLLFSDEAFWAGDKQGESTLKGLLTEPTMMIEQKGVDATPWKNRLKVIMAANNEWVVPAGPMERRYAVFNVSDRRVGDYAYFNRLNEELEAGGLAAMAYDLLNLDFRGWHPRDVVKTDALIEQKMQSMTALQEWFCSVLDEGVIPGSPVDDTVPVSILLHTAQEGWQRMRDVSPVSMGRFLRKHGCYAIHTPKGTAWRFPSLADLRRRWEKDYGGSWPWSQDLTAWRKKA